MTRFVSKLNEQYGMVTLTREGFRGTNVRKRPYQHYIVRPSQDPS